MIMQTTRNNGFLMQCMNAVKRAVCLNVNGVLQNKITDDIISLQVKVKECKNEIRGSPQIFRGVFTGIIPLYFFYILWACIVAFLHPDYWTSDDFIQELMTALAGITTVLSLFAYNSDFIVLILFEKIRKKSLLLQIAEGKFFFFYTLYLIFVFVLSTSFIVYDWGEPMMFAPAAVIFAGMLIFMVCFKASLLSYLTPATVRIIAEIHDHLR